MQLHLAGGKAAPPPGTSEQVGEDDNSAAGGAYPIVDTVDEPLDAHEERAKSVEALVSLLPKTIRKKARLVLETAGIQFDRNTFRVVYSGGQRGSHLIDLLGYVLQPKFITDKRPPPPDAQQFVALLRDNPSVPDSLSLAKATDGAGTSSSANRSKSTWLAFF